MAKMKGSARATPPCRWALPCCLLAVVCIALLLERVIWKIIHFYTVDKRQTSFFLSKIVELSLRLGEEGLAILFFPVRR
jgi:hypothetical protein